MEDNPASPMPIVDRLNLLRRHQKAWDKVQIRRDYILDMRADGPWEFSRGVFAQARGARTLVFQQLPSSLRGTEEKAWEIKDIGVKIEDFSMDPDQNLLVVIAAESENTRRIHLRTMPSGSIHPLASCSSFTHASNYSAEAYNCRISADYVAVTFSREQFADSAENEDFIVWNWKSGKVVLAVSGFWLWAYTFLTTDHILLVQLELNPALVIISLHSSSPEMTPASAVPYECRLRLPDFKIGTQVLHADLRGEPTPSRYFGGHMSEPFRIADHHRLFLLTMLTVVMGEAPRTTSFAISGHAIFQHLKAAPGKMHEVNWREWLPSSCRIIPALPGSDLTWVCNVYGTCLINPISGRSPSFYMMDCNRLVFQKALSDGTYAGSEPDNWVWTPRAKEDLSRQGLYSEPITSSLPIWQRVPLRSFQGYTSAILGDDNIVLISQSQEGRTIYRVLCL